MNRMILTILFALVFCALALGQTTQPEPDMQNFEITPAAPPTPALKYEFHYDLASDRLPGNAALLYQDAILIMGPDISKALDANSQLPDVHKFDAFADQLDKPELFQELDLAARRETCNFEPPFAQMGGNTLLPHLQPIVHGLATWLEVRALRQIDQGKYEDAIKTLRVGYEMAEKIGAEPTVISGLVSLRITERMNHALTTLMNRPDAPNLYFALCEFPSRQEVFHHTMYGQRRVLILDMPLLAKVFAGQQLSPPQWRDILSTASKLNEDSKRDPVKDATPENLSSARAEYAQLHHLTTDQANAIDPIVVLGEFYALQAETISDDLFKWRGLSYPEALIKETESTATMRKAQAQQPGNPFLPMFDPAEITANFARIDRQMAALTAVEAIRSYAAANNGKLPQSLDDLADTPTPIDPSTGKPFEYRLENDSAVISSTALDAPLTYTVRIRK